MRTIRCTNYLPLRFYSGILLYLLHHIHLILIIIGFCICQLACLLKFICNLQAHARCTFTVVGGHVQSSVKFESTHVLVPAEAEQDNALPLVSAHIVNKSLSHSLFGTTFLCYLSIISWCKWSPRAALRCCLVFLSAGRLSYASQKKYVLNKLIGLLAKSSVLVRQYDYVRCL